MYRYANLYLPYGRHLWVDEEMMQHLDEIIANATAAIEQADSLVALDEVRVQYLGKKGHLTLQLQQLGKLDRKSTRLNSSHANESRMPSSA